MESLVRDNERKDQMVLDMKHEVLEVQSKSDDVVNRKAELKGQLNDAEKKIVELNVKNEDNTSKVASLEEQLAEAQKRISDLESRNRRKK